MSCRTGPIGHVDPSLHKQQLETAFELQDFAFHPAVGLWFVAHSQSLKDLYFCPSTTWKWPWWQMTFLDRCATDTLEFPNSELEHESWKEP